MKLSLNQIYLLFSLTILATVSYAEIPQETLVLNNFNFHEFTPDGKVNNNTVHTAKVDSRGRYWVGHEGGFAVFDGHSLNEFTTITDNGLKRGFVRAITEDSNGTIWLGTFGGGLYRYNEKTHQPEEVVFQGPASQDFDNRIWTLLAGPSGGIWIGSFSTGLFRYDPDTEVFEKIWQPDELTSRSGRIEDIKIHPDGRIFFASMGEGIYSISDLLNPTFRFEIACSNETDNISTRSFSISVNGDMAIGCGDRALLKLADSEIINEVSYPLARPDSFLSTHFMGDNRAVLFGSGSGTIHHVNLDTLETTLLPEGTGHNRIKPSSVIWDITETPEGVLLVSTESGLYLSQPTDRNYAVLMKHGSGADHSLEEARGVWVSRSTLVSNHLNTVYVSELPGTDFPFKAQANVFRIPSTELETPNDALYTSTNQLLYSTESNLYYSVNDKDTMEPMFPDRKESISFMIEIHENSEKYLYFGKFNGGLARTRLPLSRDNKVEVFISDSDTREFIHGYKLNDELWLTGFDGMQRFSLTTKKFLPVFSDDSDLERSRQRQFTSSVLKIDNDALLIGTSNGLFRSELNTSGEIHSYTPAIRNSSVQAMPVGALLQDDDQHALVVGTSGILRINITDGTFSSLYGEEGGLPGVRPTLGRYHQDSESKIAVLSSRYGAAVLHPKTLTFDPPPKPMMITEVATFRDNEMLLWPITSHSEQKFTHEDRVIRFRFGLLDPFEPANNEYSLRLEGFSEQWISTGDLREFSFTNLDPGKYTLQVRGHDFIRDWGNPVELEFEVLPPWWQTWWAYTLYTFIILGSLLGYFTHLRRKLQREQEISAKLREADTLKSRFLTELEIKVDEATGDLKHAVEALEIKNVELEVAQQRAQDASRLKSEFLANMSHEIRTPMNGVLGFTQLLKKSQLDVDQVEYVNTIDNSAHNLLSIINDILDISRIEAGKLIIDNTGYELRNCATEMLETLAPVAYEKNLDLVMEIASDLPLGLRGDPVRMRQVMTNLVGNAIKFTDSGHVAILLRTGIMNSEDALEIVIEDTGRGIGEADRERLFEAFERGATDVSKGVVGTGLGLVITKKLTEAMGGEINLDSTPGKGTRVTLHFPLQPDRNPENRYDNIQPLAGKQVHLVDGNEASRAALHEMLLHLGADILSRAEFDASMAQQADIVACTLTRKEFDSADEQLAAMRQQAGEDKPLICFVSSMDRIRIRELGETHSALCVPRIVQLPTLVRRIEDWLRGGTDTATKSMPSPVSGMMSGMEVVIADDNRINRFFLKKMLETHGASVHEATDGREALELLTNESINAEIALIDLHMPELSGLELAERARAAGVDIPLLVVSANVLPETRKAATAAGFDGYILKPVEEDELVDTVRRYCRREVVE